VDPTTGAARDTGKEVFRKTRGGDALDSMLFGSRAERIAEIQTMIEVIMADGRIQTMTAPQALAAGVDPKLTGQAILADLLANP